MRKQLRPRRRSQTILLALILALCATYLWTEAAPKEFTSLQDRIAAALPSLPLGKIYPLADGFFYTSSEHSDSYFRLIEISVERGKVYEARFWRSDSSVTVRALPSRCARMTQPRAWSADRFGPVSYEVTGRECSIEFMVDNAGEHGWALRVDEVD